MAHYKLQQESVKAFHVATLQVYQERDSRFTSHSVSFGGQLTRNEKGRLRVGGMDVRISLAEELGGTARLKRCLGLFEDFCVVSASVRQGVPIQVDVVDAQGTSLLAD